MPNIVIGLEGVIKLLANLKPDKAAGPDKIKPILLRELKLEVAPILKIIFQKTLISGCIPKDWKTAIVSPLYKKGDKNNPANYRPISLTCILCKCMEHIIASNITKHFTRYNILYELQHGFREKRSCETQLIQLVEELASNMAQGHQTDMVLLDFSKAFDKVNHAKLLYKLQQNGVCGPTLLWIQAFLSGRTQSVVVEGEESDQVRVSSGVPQGSVLGPLLFLLYINDLPEGIKSQVRLFADDTAVYLTVDCLDDSRALQQDLDKLQRWEAAWDMEFNPSKCQVLHITRSRRPTQSQYILHGQVLEATSSARYLGVDISSDLSWNKHINRMSNTANKTLGFLRRNIKTQHEGIKETAYKTLVRPQLEYSSSVWCPFTKQNSDKIEKVQRRAIRWVKNNYSPYESVTAMQSALGWRSLEFRRLDAKLCMLYKIVHNLVAIPIPPYFQTPVRRTRHMHPFYFRQIHTHSSYYKFSFFPMTISLWNKLPVEFVMLPELNQFKREVCKLNYTLF